MVHLPNMEDEPRETFEDPAKLFALLGISIGSSKRELIPEHLSPPPEKSTSPPASRTAENEKRGSYDTSLSYEERAALRRAEREERRRQREGKF